MLAIVFVHYRLPERRLKEHFAWNRDLYRRDVLLFVVTEPGPCTLLNSPCSYEEPMPVFSLSKTKNFGIVEALRSPLVDRIAVTDVDVAWTAEALERCKTCGPGEAIVPVYRMARNYDTRQEISHPDHGCGGTVCMTAENWRRVRYDERYEGYGGEDGRLRRDIAALGIEERRETVVYHIAHDPNAPQQNVPGAGRSDCWNRDNGFNPDNWAVNQKLYNA